MPITIPDLGTLLTLSGGPDGFQDELAASTLPLALFPVRLETRFFELDTGWTDLHVRVYPDKVHIDAHDPALTADEVVWGQRYWALQWQAGSDDGLLRDAWRMLAGRFGPERAAWVARALTPTNATSRPTGTPEFPDLGDPATTTRTALVRLLPTRWVATAYAGGVVAAVVTGNDIVPDLAIGPDLSDAVAPGTLDDETPAIDEGMRWMIDFEKAEEVGMALRITLWAPEVDVLLVTGVRDGDGSSEVAAQLDGHHYTDGLAFLPAGTPTNNTAAGRSGYQAPDPRQDQSYANEFLQSPGDGSAAALATAAFGAPAFATIAGAANDDATVARAMVTALWPATWGYFLSQMIGFEGTLTVAGRDWLRTHALEHLRPGGPVPVLRCGRQPYGVLPVTSLDGLASVPEAPDAAAVEVLQGLLKALRNDVWRPAASFVPRVGLTDVPGADLVDVLRVAPVSTSYMVRPLMGQHFLQHLWAFLGVELDFVGFWPELVTLGDQEPQRLAIGFTPQLAHAAYGGPQPVTVPLVGDPTYIADLLNADLDALETAPAAAMPLLQAVLRHSLLREYTEAAARLLDSPTTPFTSLVRDLELIDLLPDLPPASTWARLRSQQLSDGQTVAQRLATDPGPEITALRDAFQVLAGTDAPTLERHLAGTLDATSHRLDAWVTSLASRRLAEIRAQHPTGVTIGGYGWVENLRKATPPADAPATPDEPAPLVVHPADPGFIHAPSLNQASAAALLRNAHLAHGSDENSAYAVELTSARVRLAQHLFDGVRQGQPLAGLLGYVFERGLHEADLDVFIDDFRALAPLAGAAGTRLVVDGLALSQRWQADPVGLLASIAGPPDGDPRRATVSRVLDGLGSAVDAAADAVTAEGAFQMVRGNFARAAGSLDAIASGQAAPPDLGFVRTPRTGTGLTHRVALLVSADDQAITAGWAESSPRAAADPALAAWAGRLLGPVSDLAAQVHELGPDGAVTATHVVPLTALNLAAIDLIWATGGVDGAPPEILARVLDAAVRAADGPDPTANLRVELGGLGVLVELASRGQRLLAGARPIDGADLQPPHADPSRGLDLDEYEQRVVAAEQALAAAQTELADALASTAADDGAGLRAAMVQVAAFGVTGSMPAPGLPLDVQARTLLPELTRRLAPTSRAEPPDDEARRNQLLDRLRTVFGPGFLALPRFIAANAADLEASLADAEALVGDDPLAAYTWVQRMSRVRLPLSRLGRAFMEAEVLRTGEALDLSIAQLPHVDGQRWVGLDQPDGTTPTDGCISLVLQRVPADLSVPLCGLLVDELTEVVPSSTETTGIAFQYDPPDASAPQAILLAVPPVVGEPWTVGSLNRVLLETLDLMRMRAVDPIQLGDVAHYLPAAFFAFNAVADVVSTDFQPLAR